MHKRYPSLKDLSVSLTERKRVHARERERDRTRDERDTRNIKVYFYCEKNNFLSSQKRLSGNGWDIKSARTNGRKIYRFYTILFTLKQFTTLIRFKKSYFGRALNEYRLICVCVWEEKVKSDDVRKRTKCPQSVIIRERRMLWVRVFIIIFPNSCICGVDMLIHVVAQNRDGESVLSLHIFYEKYL